MDSRAAEGGRPKRLRRCRAEQTCELRHSPTRPKGGAAPKQKNSETSPRPASLLGSTKCRFYLILLHFELAILGQTKQLAEEFFG